MPTSKLRKNRKQPKSTITRMNRNRKRRSRKLVTKTHKIKLGGGFSYFETYDNLLDKLENISKLPIIQRRFNDEVQQNLNRFKAMTNEQRSHAKPELQKHLADIDSIVKSDSEDTQLLEELSVLISNLQQPKDQALRQQHETAYNDLLKNKNVNAVLEPDERAKIKKMNKALKELTGSFGYRK